MQRNGVGRALLVTHNAFQGAHNDYILDAVRRNPGVFRACAILNDDTHGATGGVAHLNGSALVAQMKQLTVEDGVVAFRITPWGNGDAMLKQQRKVGGWLQDAMWAEAARTGQALCALLDPADLDELRAMCARFPDTTVVVDHMA